MCVHGYNQVVLGHGAKDKNQGQLVIRSLNIVVMARRHKAMIDIYKKILNLLLESSLVWSFLDANKREIICKTLYPVESIGTQVLLASIY